MKPTVRGVLLVTCLMGLLGAAGCQTKSVPTVQPADVVLTATVRPADPTVCDPDVRWVLEVSINRTRSVDLDGGEKAYMSAVYAFDGQRPLSPSDVGQGCTADFGARSISLGNDGRTYSAAVRAARTAGALPAAYPDTRSEGAGFTYTGNAFPVTVRYYLGGNEPPAGRVAVVYAHFEQGSGRDLSWTQVVNAQVLKALK